MHDQSTQQEEQPRIRCRHTEICAQISAELARVQDREHMAALCSVQAEGGQTIPDVASSELGVERRY